MAEYIDILAQLKFDIEGDERLSGVVKNIDKSVTEAAALQARIAGLRDAIRKTDSEAKKGVLNAELKKANTQLKALEANAKDATKEVTKLSNAGKGGAGGGIGGLVGGLGGVFAGLGIVEIGRQIIDATSQFQKFEAVLTNLTGDNGEAKQLINTFTQFAAETPFQVEEVINAYIKLRNTGIAPNVEAMRRLGDVASASGKDLNQLVEALIDAQVGENERLKEFGIRAQRAGDVTRFTFRGVTTEVKNTSEAINEYIVGLGDLQGVQGANAAIAATLQGQISNLKDSLSLFAKELGTLVTPALNGFLNVLSNTAKGWNLLLKGINRNNEVWQEAKDIFGSLPDTFQDKKGFDFIIKSLNDLETAIGYGGQGTLARVKALQNELNEAFSRGIITQDVLFKLSARLQQAVVDAQKVNAETKKQVSEGLSEAQKKEAERTAKIISDAQKALVKDIEKNNKEIQTLRLDNVKESEATIRQGSDILLQAELAEIDRRQSEIKEKLKGSIPASLAGLFQTLRSQINEKFQIELEADLEAFNKKRLEAIGKYQAELLAMTIQVEIEALNFAAEKSEEAARKRQSLIFEKRQIEIEKQRQQAILDAQELGLSVADTNKVYDGLIENEQRDHVAEMLKIQHDFITKRLAAIKQADEIELAQTRDAGARSRIEYNNLQRQAAFLISQLNTLTNPEQVEKVKEALRQIRVALAGFEDGGGSGVAEKETTGQVSVIDSIKSSYLSLADVVRQVNDFIVADEQNKVNRLIELQQTRVNEANAIADKGNAEALERERQRLEHLTEQRERAAARQQRLSSILQTANMALAATEAILAVTKAAGESGVGAPVVVPLVAAALVAGTGFVLSLLNTLKGSVNQFHEGTPFVTGKRGKDKVPAMLSYGERVVTADNNRKYGEVFDYITKTQPNPTLLKRRLSIDTNGMVSTYTAANGEKKRQELFELQRLNSNIEILIRKSGGMVDSVNIGNPSEIAKYMTQNQIKWRI